MASRSLWALGAAVLIAIVVSVAWRASAPPSRCGDGFVAMGTRCCGEGQTLDGDVCVGRPTRCGSRHELTPRGCVSKRDVVAIAGGSVRVGPSDWEAQGVVAPREISVKAFSIDRFEIDVARFEECRSSGICRGSANDGDPGRAASVSFDDATALCRAAGGRLPTDDEWTFAAMGERAHRYPWGDTGAVCSRAAYGLVSGPCASGATGPDTVGSRPLGVSPEGLFDLAGNVAEWTTNDGAPRLRGGSYASMLATDLRGWNVGSADLSPREAGARCVYEPSR